MKKGDEFKDEIRSIQNKLMAAGWIKQIVEVDKGDGGAVGVIFTPKGRKHINAFIRMHVDLEDFSEPELELLYRYLHIIISFSMEQTHGKKGKARRRAG